MKRLFKYRKLISLLVTIAVLLVSCSNNKKLNEENSDVKPTHKSAAIKYTCPMHPHVLSDKPGKCPVCGMDLVPKSNESANDIPLGDTQIKLANITTQNVSMMAIGQTISVNGRLNVDQYASEIVSSRANGRIEKLYVKESGRSIQKGEPLYQLYSENLLALQKEFLLAKQQYEAIGNEKRFQSFYESARRKLKLFGLTNEQVEKIEHDNVAQTTVTLTAPVSGIVTKVSAVEGQYVSEGDELMKIENLNNLWLEAELYPTEASLTKPGDAIDFRISGFENETTKATIQFVTPELKSNSQVIIMRALVQNQNRHYQPGMQAEIFFNHTAKKGLSVPTDAVIRDEHGTHVYVQRGANTFRPKVVTTGIEDFDKVEITEGLTVEDTVVVTGAYLLYSELLLKTGNDPMKDHIH